MVTGHIWWRLVAGLAVVFALFHLTAERLGSVRGEWGVLIAAIVVAATLMAEHVLLPRAPSTVWPAFRRPNARGLIAAAGVSALMIAVVPIAAICRGWTVALDREFATAQTFIGIFAQAGTAEETLFRAYLYGHVREGRSFWTAAMKSVAPFAAVHLLLFWTMPWPIAAASVVLAVVISFPLAYLYELGGRTVWPPALVHAVIQGTLKVIVVNGEDPVLLPLIWMAASVMLPLAVFVVSRKPSASDGRSD